MSLPEEKRVDTLKTSPILLIGRNPLEPEREELDRTHNDGSHDPLGGSRKKVGPCLWGLNGKGKAREDPLQSGRSPGRSSRQREGLVTGKLSQGERDITQHHLFHLDQREKRKNRVYWKKQHHTGKDREGREDGG